MTRHDRLGFHNEDFDREFRRARRFGVAAFFAALLLKLVLLAGLFWLAVVLLRGFGFL